MYTESSAGWVRQQSDATSLSFTAKAYAYAVVGGGTLAIAASLTELSLGSVPAHWVLLAALALFSGIFATKVPSLRATVSVSETLVLALVVLFGPAPAVATVVVEGLIASARMDRWSVYGTLFTVAAPAFAVWCSAALFYRLAAVEPLLLGHMMPVTAVFLPLVVLSASYFALAAVVRALWGWLESGDSCREFFRNRHRELVVGCGVTTVLLALLVRSASTMSTLAICAVGIVTALIALSHTLSKTHIAHVESANRQLAALNDLYVVTVETLASAIDAKDQVTSGHIRRVQQSTLRLARELGISDPDELKALECASLLHDLGKLVVPEHVLNKPGSLSGPEFDQMKRHATIGAEILSNVGFP